MTGFSEAERRVVANVARYHRRSTPKERHPDFAELNATDRETVWRLGAILRVADALDRSHDARVADLRVLREGQIVHVQIQSEADCEKEILGAESRRDMFEQAFGCKLTLSSRAATKPAKLPKGIKPHKEAKQTRRA